MFPDSLKASRDDYRRSLEQVETGTLDLPNRDFDTGQPTRDGEYRLADRTYANLLAPLRKDYYQNVTPELRCSNLAFYAHLDTDRPIKHCKVCRAIPKELDEIKTAPVTMSNVGADAR
jgi:hypothetical protein